MCASKDKVGVRGRGIPVRHAGVYVLNLQPFIITSVFWVVFCIMGVLQGRK